MVLAAAGIYAQDYRPLPAPVLALNGTEYYVPSGGPATMYKLTITNWSSYPDGLFVPRPDLPPCGSNTEASRAWVEIYDAGTDQYIYGFCALGANESLTDIWFGILLSDPDQSPPPVYVKIIDRDTSFGGTYTSNSVTVPMPTAPVANTDTLALNEDSSSAANVLSNDTDVNADQLDVTVIHTAASHGSAVVLANNTISYTPAADYSGPDSFAYELSDGSFTVFGTVNVTVNPVPDFPNANNDGASVAEDGAVSIPVLSNDTDADGDTLSISGGSATDPPHGSAAIAGSSIAYTPDVNYNGSDSFQYTLNDGTGRTDVATVTVTVSSVPDAPNAPSGLQTDGGVNPVNVSRYTPLFSWLFSDVDQADAAGDSQSAYRIRIGTAPSSASANVWDSGKVPASAPSAPYAGPALSPNATYYWSVSVWDDDDLQSPYAADGTFTILDIGLRVRDGAETVRIAVDYVSAAYPLRINRNGTVFRGHPWWIRPTRAHPPSGSRLPPASRR